MAFQVYDYRTDVRNVLVTPQIRARFMRMEVGEVSGGRRVGQGHSHDLGHEVFLVLQGRVEFEIAGEKQVLGPGQMCVALADESHTLRNVGDEPGILYLSVTPHIQPTHTGWTESGARSAVRFNASTAYDVPRDPDTPTQELTDRYLDAFRALARIVESAKGAQEEQINAFRQALGEGDKEDALRIRNAMWDTLYPLFSQVYRLAETWNQFTYRTAEDEF